VKSLAVASKCTKPNKPITTNMKGAIGNSLDLHDGIVSNKLSLVCGEELESSGFGSPGRCLEVDNMES